jgi:hypothetical protein
MQLLARRRRKDSPIMKARKTIGPDSFALRARFVAAVVALHCLAAASVALAQAVPAKRDAAPTIRAKATAKEAGKEAADKPAAQKPAAKPSALGDPKGFTRLVPDQDVWIDAKRKWVVVDGKVALREGQLEMFACPAGSKEHESIVAVNSKAYLVHTALLAVGAKDGEPVQFFPDYKPATGETIDIYVQWIDDKGNKQLQRAQEWVKHVKNEKAMEYDWVFAGSSFYKDESTGEEYYQAEAGDLICVSNFTTATIDLPVESSQSASGLLFSAFTERIPSKDTPVRLLLIPRGKKATAPKTPMLE